MYNKLFCFPKFNHLPDPTDYIFQRTTHSTQGRLLKAQLQTFNNAYQMELHRKTL